MIKSNPTIISYLESAVQLFLQASVLHKNVSALLTNR